jgi:hypothetical protein
MDTDEEGKNGSTTEDAEGHREKGIDRVNNSISVPLCVLCG